jgi:hypothetical protein
MVMLAKKLTAASAGIGMAYIIGIPIRDYLDCGRESETDRKIKELILKENLVFRSPFLWNDTFFDKKCQCGRVEVNKRNNGLPNRAFTICFDKDTNAVVLSYECGPDLFCPKTSHEITIFCFQTLQKMHSQSAYSRFLGIVPASEKIMIASASKGSKISSTQPP